MFKKGDLIKINIKNKSNKSNISYGIIIKRNVELLNINYVQILINSELKYYNINSIENVN